ncbi:MAG TPA: VTT domain-containing protein [Usitatibacter sp.]|jgi:membrane protein DedA with SNARE-associated domain/rhodanese-related sulfurtransferase|nr:VTT domain-containing protein [Usitatibacter sp.]
MDPFDLLARWGAWLLFGITLAGRAGLPVPVEPFLICAGALAHDGTLGLSPVLVATMAACLLCDQAWYAAGQWRGRELLAGVCRVSISPDTCVRKTDDLISRYGAALLLVSKYAPGISLVAVPTAAASGLAYRRFVLYDAAGCALWCGPLVAAGWIFSREVRALLEAMARWGPWAVVAVAVLFAGYIGAKLLERRRLRRLYGLVRIDPEEAAGLLAREGSRVAILDARSKLAREEDPRRLPHSILVEDEEAIDVLPPELRAKIVITFCTCPNEASAALYAERLLRAGYERVRVLTGGKDALAILALPP